MERLVHLVPSEGKGRKGEGAILEWAIPLKSAPSLMPLSPVSLPCTSPVLCPIPFQPLLHPWCARSLNPAFPPNGPLGPPPRPGSSPLLRFHLQAPLKGKK